MLEDCIPADHVILGIFANLSSDTESQFDTLLEKLRDTYIFTDLSNEIEAHLILTSTMNSPKTILYAFSEMDMEFIQWNKKDKSKIKSDPKPLIIRYKGILGIPDISEKWDEMLQQQIISTVSGETGNAWLEIKDNIFTPEDSCQMVELFKKDQILYGKLDFDLSGFESLLQGNEVRLLNLDIVLLVYINQGKKSYSNNIKSPIYRKSLLIWDLKLTKL